MLGAQALEQRALGRRQVERVAIHVDALGVAPRVDLRTVGVEPRHHQQRQLVEQSLHPGVAPVAQEEVRDVEQGRRRRRLVAVHLRPQQDLALAPSEGRQVDRPPLERLADALDGEVVGIEVAEFVERGFEVVEAQARRRLGDEALFGPGVPQLLRTEMRGHFGGGWRGWRCVG